MDNSFNFDITILTDHRYVDPVEIDEYTQNVLDEDRLLAEALERKGFKVTRTNWDDPNFNWTETRYILFRSTWDYFDRYPEFSVWLENVSTKTKLINPKELIYWNLDKHYLQDLKNAGINIPPTIFIEKGDKKSLNEILSEVDWKESILKPAVSGAARHTYRLNSENIHKHEAIFAELLENESMLLQEFQTQILTKGEVAFMVYGGKFSHAILKKAKPGDFRVQDDFGGTIESYQASSEEIEMAEKAVLPCSTLPMYARVDLIWDNDDNLAIGELELIEPELWFRMNRQSADDCAEAVYKELNINVEL